MVKKTEQSHPGRNKNPGIKPNVSQCFKAEKERERECVFQREKMMKQMWKIYKIVNLLKDILELEVFATLTFL